MLRQVGPLQMRMFINDTLRLGADWNGSPAYYGMKPAQAAYLFFGMNEPASALHENGFAVSIPMGCPGPGEVMARLCSAYKELRDIPKSLPGT